MFDTDLLYKIKVYASPRVVSPFQEEPSLGAFLEYADDGSLIITQEHQAVDPNEAASRCLRAMAEGKTMSINGRDVAVRADSICVHSDTPNAVEVARAVRDALTSYDRP